MVPTSLLAIEPESTYTTNALDDAAIGPVASLTNATTLELTEAIATSVLEDDDYVYCKNPIKIILHFEK